MPSLICQLMMQTCSSALVVVLFVILLFIILRHALSEVIMSYFLYV
jgi:hypothetical protein